MFHTAKSNSTIIVVLFTCKNSNINDRTGAEIFKKKEKKRGQVRLG